MHRAFCNSYATPAESAGNGRNPLAGKTIIFLDDMQNLIAAEVACNKCA